MKRLLIPLMLMMLVVLITGCASAEQPMQNLPPMTTLNPTMIPSPDSDNVAPGDVGMSMTNEGMGNFIDPGSSVPEAQGVTNVINARKAMEQIEDELERLSEVTEAQVVLAGNTAAVALRFDKQYQGGVDARLEKMVQDRIKSVVSGISNVAVTQDTMIFDQLDKLGDRMETASDMAAIQRELEELVSEMRQKA